MDYENRETEAGVSVELRIRSGLTHFFEVENAQNEKAAKDAAYEKAREIKSYIYPCFQEIRQENTLRGKKHIRKIKEFVGYCVPV